mmetsp:Transcript_24637/g.30711  ORF Transcript_24637/g.30711 Transcript_24637/m.30711 type:complete len:200 (+) Transcript_24637:1667-2266(+)
MAFNSRRNRGSEHIKDVLLLGKLANVLDVLLAQTRLLFLGEQASNASGDNLSAESAASDSHVHVGCSPKNASDFDAIARLDAINKVVLQNNLDAARELTRGRTLRHFLNSHDLRVFVQAVAVLVGERISILILYRESFTAVVRTLVIGAHLSQVRVVVVVTHLTFLRGFAVVDRGLDHGLHKAHARHDAPHGDQLVDQI